MVVILGAALLASGWAVPEVTQAQLLRFQSASILLSAADLDPAQIENQLRNVERLLNRSSGAQRVLGSDNALAKQIRDDALARYKRAQESYRSGEWMQAQRLLNEVSRIMFQAIRVLGPQEESVEKRQRDFEARAESVTVLMQALERIAGDEGEAGKAAGTIEGITATVRRARRMMESGDPNAARRLLDGGYEMAKQAVDHLRDGKTLVRSLSFATPEEEYRYELDRNDTHQMLVSVLLDEKPPAEQVRAAVEQRVAQARKLRSEAEHKASRGDYRGAIDVLEAATKELVRAIRGAGIYIPG